MNLMRNKALESNGMTSVDKSAGRRFNSHSRLQIFSKWCKSRTKLHGQMGIMLNG